MEVYTNISAIKWALLCIGSIVITPFVIAKIEYYVTKKLGMLLAGLCIIGLVGVLFHTYRIISVVTQNQ